MRVSLWVGSHSFYIIYCYTFIKPFVPSVPGAKEPVSFAEGELRGIERGRLTKVVSLRGYRWFESISLQRRVSHKLDFPTVMEGGTGRVAAALIDQLWSAIEALPDPEPQPDPKRPSKQEARMMAREVKFVRWIRTIGPP